jgi:hypothetical protein
MLSSVSFGSSKEVHLGHGEMSVESPLLGNGHGAVRRETVGNTGDAVRRPSILLCGVV